MEDIHSDPHLTYQRQEQHIEWDVTFIQVALVKAMVSSNIDIVSMMKLIYIGKIAHPLDYSKLG
jgi:hypothetical protein